MKTQIVLLSLVFVVLMGCREQEQKPNTAKPTGQTEEFLSSGKTKLPNLVLSTEEQKEIAEAVAKVKSAHKGRSRYPVAVSARGNYHVSSGADTKLFYPDTITNEGNSWKGAEGHVGNDLFIAPYDGLYLFAISFLKDAYYNGGTEDDVDVRLYVCRNGKDSEYVGRAWSGEGAGKRGTGAYTVVLKLRSGDCVVTYASSDDGNTRHLYEYNFACVLVSP